MVDFYGNTHCVADMQCTMYIFTSKVCSYNYVLNSNIKSTLSGFIRAASSRTEAQLSAHQHTCTHTQASTHAGTGAHTSGHQYVHYANIDKVQR